MSHKAHTEGIKQNENSIKAGRQNFDRTLTEDQAAESEDDRTEESEGNHYDEDDTTLNAAPERDDIEYFRRYGFEGAPGSGIAPDSQREIDPEHQKNPGSDVAH